MAKLGLRREYKQDLYNVAERYEQALMKSRLARGEPAGGLRRAAWETRRGLQQRPWRAASMGASILAASALAIGAGRYLNSRINSQKNRAA